MSRNRTTLLFPVFSAIFFVMLFCFLSGSLQNTIAQGLDDDPLKGLMSEPAQSSAIPATVNSAGGETTPEPPKNSDVAPPERKIYLVWMIQSLGWFFTPVFLIMSVCMVALAVMNYLAIRPNNFAPKDFVAQFGELLDAKQYQEAYEYCKSSDCMISKVLASGLAKLSSGYDESERVMQATGEEETMKHEHKLGYIALIGKIAPMVGLFGTVVGMIDSFNVIASSAGSPPANKLAEGIATALFTTEIGLAIAIPALIVFDILRNRLTQNLMDVSMTTDNLMSRFSGISK